MLKIRSLLWQRFVVAIATAWLSISGAEAQEPRWPTDEEQDHAAKPYQDCMHAEAERVDDGRTDIGVMGARVDASCSAEFNHMIEELGRMLTPDELQTLREREQEMRVGFGAAAVGKVRNERRSPNP